MRGVRAYMAYDRALAAGLPIATRVIEGAYRYCLVAEEGGRCLHDGA